MLENRRVFEIRDVFVACGQPFRLRPAERPVMKHDVLVCYPIKKILPQIPGVGYKECSQVVEVPYHSTGSLSIQHLRRLQESSRIDALASYSLTKLQTEISTTLMLGFSLSHNKLRISERHISVLWCS